MSVMSPALAPFTFRITSRTRMPARAAGVRGAGLGLAIARRIADAMEARLAAESTVGRGSRFAVWLPAAATGEA